MSYDLCAVIYIGVLYSFPEVFCVLFAVIIQRLEESVLGVLTLHLALHSLEEHRHNILDCRLCTLAVNAEHSAYLIKRSALKHHLHDGFHIHGLYPPCRLANTRNIVIFVVKL